MYYSTPVPNDLSPRTMVKARLVDVFAGMCRVAATESPGQIDAMSLIPKAKRESNFLILICHPKTKPII